jgi:hypothetical protein
LLSLVQSSGRIGRWKGSFNDIFEFNYCNYYYDNASVTITIYQHNC